MRVGTLSILNVSSKVYLEVRFELDKNTVDPGFHC